MEKTMYVRFVGTGVCYTIMDGSERFYMAKDRSEAKPEELALCEKGGGELPLSFAIAICAS